MYWKRSNMPKFIELMTTENVTEIRNVSMYIMKSFEIRKKSLFRVSMSLTLSCIYVLC